MVCGSAPAKEKPDTVAHKAHVVSKTQGMLAVSDDYVPTGSGRLPGSQYTITEVEILDCHSQRELEAMVRKHVARGRKGCCGQTTGVLAKWKYVDDQETAIKLLKRKEKEYFPAGNGAGEDDGEDLTPSDLIFVMFLGLPGDHNSHDPPNPNCFNDDDDEEEHMLRFNRKKLVMDVYNDEQPPFRVKAEGQSVTMISRPTDKQIEKWSRKELRQELTRRGFVKAPYNIKVLRKDGTSALVIIKKDKVEAPPGLKEAKAYEKGLPSVRRMDEAQLKALLKLIGRDPRFKDGQPIVQPAYYQRSCQNCWCCGLFLLYWLGMFILAAVALTTGNPYRLIRPIDYQGNTCGGAHQVGKRTLYYPRLAEDAFGLYTNGNDGCEDTAAGCFYGVCVDSCPSKGDIVCSYEVQNLLESEYAGNAEGLELAKKTRANDQNGCWRVAMQQVEILLRCLPYARAEEQKKYWCSEEKFAPDGVSLVRTSTPIGTANCPCQWNGADPICPVVPDPLPDPFPAALLCNDANVCTGDKVCNEGQMEKKLNTFCKQGVIKREVTNTAEYTQGTETMTKYMTSFVMYFESLMADVTHCWFVILGMGPLLAGVMSFLFIFLLSFYAGTIIWWTLYAMQATLGLICVFFSYQCGYLETLFVKLKAKLADDDNSGSWYVDDDTDGGPMAVENVASSATNFLENYGAFGDDDDGDSSDTSMKMWTVAFWVAFLVFLISFCLLIAMRKHIQMAVELIKEAGRTVRKMKSLMVFPFFSYFFIFLFFSYFLFMSLYIFTTEVTMDSLREGWTAVRAASDDLFHPGNSSNTSMTKIEAFRSFFDVSQDIAADFKDQYNFSDPSYNISAVEDNHLVRYLFLYHTLGYLWAVEFIKAIGMITISGAIASDYWITSEAMRPGAPMLGSLFRTLRYHMGSAAFGSLIIALVRLARYVMMYVDEKTSQLQKDNRAVKILMVAIHCLMWCLEKICRYITETAYILIAIEGRGFCVSAWRSFQLLYTNSLRIATTKAIAFAVVTLANIGVALMCTAGTVIILQEVPYFTEGEGYVDTVLFPALLVFISAGFVAFCFMQVYSQAVDTILMSFCLDEDKFKKGMYEKKLGNSGDIDGRMFCVINKKVALIKMVSKSTKKQQQEMEGAVEDTEAAKLAFEERNRVENERRRAGAMGAASQP